jgi:GTP cyclohydrolase II
LVGGVSGQIKVERALSEIRSGRPVAVFGAQTCLIATPIEALDGALARDLDQMAQGRARLILAAPRLRRLGLDRKEAGALALPKLDLARIASLAVETDARIDAPVSSLSREDEAALELMRLALVLPALVVFSSADADLFSLVHVDVQEVMAYHRAQDDSLKIISRAPVPLEGASESEFVVFRGGEGLRDQVAVVVGKPDLSKPVTVRLHSACLTGDLFGSLKCDCGDQLRHTARFMAENGGGILLYLDQEGRGNGLSNKIRAYRLQAQGFDTYDADEVLGFDHDQRGFAFAASMLKQLGVSIVRVMTNNPVKIAALEDAGLTVAADQRIIGRLTDQNIRYLASKRDRAGHFIDVLDQVPPAQGGAKD